jgi:hypothetical protein
VPLIIPTASSTFADSVSTGGGPLRKYILAQYGSDADFSWVKALRAILVQDELKYVHVRDARPKLEGDRSLWRVIKDGIRQATVIVIDPQPFAQTIEDLFRAEHAEPGIDYTENDVLDCCATAIVGHTPIAYLPERLNSEVPWSHFTPVTPLQSFAPEEIRKRLGGGLRDAKILAARAHAMFDLRTTDMTVFSTRDVLLSPLRKVLLLELLATYRVFDQEHPQSVNVLNEAVRSIADGMADTLPIWPQGGQPLIREVDSRAIDEIQAADVAAGWSRELLELGDLSAVALAFRRVYLNGRRL